ncbi:hypothetical protein ACOMHN_044140 [Nucella lapillus]
MAAGMDVFFTLCVALALWWCPTDTQYLPGTVAVRWKLYSSLELTWNEASHFCRSKGGHLATLNTHLAQWAVEQFMEQRPSVRSGERPNVWEKDCSLQTTSVAFWYPGEPNYLSQELCNRLYRTGGQLMWRTKGCGSSFTVLCEQDAGNCTYDHRPNTRMTSDAHAIIVGVYDVSTCWQTCLAVRKGSDECVAAELRASRGVCRMWVTSRLLMTSEVVTANGDGYTLMIRTCFDTSVDTQTRTYDYINTLSTPTRAAGRCPSQYHQVTYTDYVPPGVSFGSYPYNTSPMMSSSTEVTSSSVDVTTTSSVTTFSEETTAVLSTQGEESDTGPPSTIEGVISPGASPSKVTELFITSDNMAASVFSALPVTSPTPRKTTLCPCACVRKKAPPSTNPVPPKQEEVIVANSTSRYRRSKTSVYTSRPLDVGVGVVFVIGSCLPILAFVCCDLFRLLHYIGQHHH